MTRERQGKHGQAVAMRQHGRDLSEVPALVGAEGAGSAAAIDAGGGYPGRSGRWP